MKCGFIQELRPSFNVQSDSIRTRFLIRFLIFIFNLVIVISLRLFFLFVCSYCPFTLPKKILHFLHAYIYIHRNIPIIQMKMTEVWSKRRVSLFNFIAIPNGSP